MIQDASNGVSPAGSDSDDDFERRLVVLAAELGHKLARAGWQVSLPNRVPEVWWRAL